MLIFLALFTISGTFAAAFQCNPPRYFYDTRLHMAPDRAAHCLSAHASYVIFLYQAVLIFACDNITFFLPIPALLQLNLSTAKRVVLILAFASGGVACIAPALRFSSLSFHNQESAGTTCTSSLSEILDTCSIARRY